VAPVDRREQGLEEPQPACVGHIIDHAEPLLKLLGQRIAIGLFQGVNVDRLQQLVQRGIAVVQVERMGSLELTGELPLEAARKFDLDHGEIAVFRIGAGAHADYRAQRKSQGGEDQLLPDCILCPGLEECALLQMLAPVVFFLTDTVLDHQPDHAPDIQRQLILEHDTEQEFNILVRDL